MPRGDSEEPRTALELGSSRGREVGKEVMGLIWPGSVVYQRLSVEGLGSSQA